MYVRVFVSPEIIMVLYLRLEIPTLKFPLQNERSQVPYKPECMGLFRNLSRWPHHEI